MCKENPTLLNGMELRGRSVLFDRDQFAIGYRTFVYRDARYAASRTDPRPFGPASAANRLATASDVALARQVLEHSAQACRNPACSTLAQDNVALRRRLRRLTTRLRARLFLFLSSHSHTRLSAVLFWKSPNTVESERGRKRRCVEGGGAAEASASEHSSSDSSNSESYSDSDYGGWDEEDEDGAMDEEKEEEVDKGAAAGVAGRLPKPFGIDEAPLLLKVLGQTAVPFGMEHLTLSSLGFPEAKRENTPPPQPQQPQQQEEQKQKQEQEPPPPLPELDIIHNGGGAAASAPFVPTDALLAQLDAGLQAVRADLARQRAAARARPGDTRQTAPLRDRCIAPFHGSVLARAAATGGLAFTPYVYREPHDLLTALPPPAPPAAGQPPLMPQQQQQQQPQQPAEPAQPQAPPRGWLPIKPSHITAEHFTTGIPLPRPVTSTKLVDCKDFILSSCHNVCSRSSRFFFVIIVTSVFVCVLQQPSCAFRHCNSARQQWHLKRGGGACFDWLRGLCTNEACRFVHFPPAAVLATVPPPV